MPVNPISLRSERGKNNWLSHKELFIELDNLQMCWSCLAKTWDQVTAFLWHVGKMKDISLSMVRLVMQEGPSYSLQAYPAVDNNVHLLLWVQTPLTSIAEAFGKAHWVSALFFKHTIVLYCGDRKIQVTKKCFTGDVGLLGIAVFSSGVETHLPCPRKLSSNAFAFCSE